MKRGYCFLHILLKQCENKTETIYTRAINYFSVESDCPSFMLVFIFSDSILFIEGIQVKVKRDYIFSTCILHILQMTMITPFNLQGLIWASPQEN